MCPPAGDFLGALKRVSDILTYFLRSVVEPVRDLIGHHFSQ